MTLLPTYSSAPPRTSLQVPTSALRTFAVGELIGGRFRVIGVLGEGGTGAVHRVSDEHGGPDLALKQVRLTDRVQAPLAISHFEREYQTLCQLAHPRIIEVYDYGVDRGTPFYTMELLDGHDLVALRRSPWRTACRLLCDIASSLAILHSRKYLHRDVSARNVRCTSQGRAKLIDFGSMGTIGPAKAVLGTAPFVAPEVLQLESLDGRADLYSLGALAYYLLTGYHAYHARSLHQLWDLWKVRPISPAEYQPDIPKALDQLVMELLQLSRDARPRSAAEVMERLCGIAGLPLEELPQVARAYLVMPALVGRDAIIEQVRDAMTRTLAGQGGCVLIDAARGMGRSRLLDACALEARMMGLLVLRGDGSEGDGRKFGLATALCTQLLQAVPEVAEPAAEGRRGALEHVIPQLTIQGMPPAEPQADTAIQTALRDFLLTVARERPFLIAVDDIDFVDDASTTLLAALADMSRRRGLMLVVTAKATSAQSRGIAIMSEAARHITLAPFDQVETEALLRSVFGNVEYITGLAQRIHERADGNPGWIIELAERLVERGVARYEAGSWSLPAELTSDDLPESLTAVLRARLMALPEDALDLAEALSLTEATLIPSRRYRILTEHEDALRTSKAVDALLAASVFVPSGEGHRFAQPAYAELLRADLSLDRKHLLHTRLAKAFRSGDDQGRRVYHLLCAGHERAAIERLIRLMQRHGMQMRVDTRLMLEVFERTVAIAEREGLPQRTAWPLRAGLVLAAARAGNYASFVRRARAVLAEAVEGVSTPSPGPRTSVPPAAFTVSLPAPQGPSPRMAPISSTPDLRTLRALCMSFVGMAAIAQDIELLEGLPALDRFESRDPSMRIVNLLIALQTDVESGSFASAIRRSRTLLDILGHADELGMSGEPLKGLRLSQVYLQALCAAANGLDSARTWLAELEREPGYRVHAFRARMVYELMLGRDDAANACRRRAELFSLQDTALVLPGTTARIELLAHIAADDVLGVKHAIDRLSRLAALYPKWKPTLDVARSHYRRLQGDFVGALEALEPALAATAPGRHLDWRTATSAHVTLLCATGRAAEGAKLGLQYLAASPYRVQDDDVDTGMVADNLELAVIHALTRIGFLDDALAMASRSVRLAEAAGVRGLILGRIYEARARVALAMDDAETLVHFGRLSAQAYGGGRNPKCGLALQSLIRDAEAAGIFAARLLEPVPTLAPKISTRDSRRRTRTLPPT